jgi:hypothetical protein
LHSSHQLKAGSENDECKLKIMPELFYSWRIWLVYFSFVSYLPDDDSILFFKASIRKANSNIRLYAFYGLCEEECSVRFQGICRSDNNLFGSLVGACGLDKDYMRTCTDLAK